MFWKFWWFKVSILTLIFSSIGAGVVLFIFYGNAKIVLLAAGIECLILVLALGLLAWGFGHQTHQR